MLPGFSAKASQPEGPAAVRREGPLDLERRGGDAQGESRVQACGEGLNCYRVLHSHAPIIHSTVLQDNGPAWQPDCKWLR